MNTNILFAIGVILGILISMAILQTDVISRLGFGYPEEIAVQAKQTETVLKKLEKQATIQQEKFLLPPALEVREETISRFEPLRNQDTAQGQGKIEKKPTPVIKWAPGKESNINKFLQAATTVQEEVFGDEKPQQQSKSTSTSNSLELPNSSSRENPKEKLKKFATTKLKKDSFSSNVIAVDSKETPIQLENQMKLYSKLKTKEKLFVGDNDEITDNMDIKQDETAGSPLKKKSKAEKLAALKGVGTDASSVRSIDLTNVTITNGNGMPPIAYHEQCMRDFSTYRPSVPTLPQATSEGFVCFLLFVIV
jgi:predicted GIY-YIG superfamily endonuclease